MCVRNLVSINNHLLKYLKLQLEVTISSTLGGPHRVDDFWAYRRPDLSTRTKWEGRYEMTATLEFGQDGVWKGRSRVETKPNRRVVRCYHEAWIVDAEKIAPKMPPLEYRKGLISWVRGSSHRFHSFSLYVVVYLVMGKEIWAAYLLGWGSYADLVKKLRVLCCCCGLFKNDIMVMQEPLTQKIRPSR